MRSGSARMMVSNRWRCRFASPPPAEAGWLALFTSSRSRMVANLTTLPQTCKRFARGPAMPEAVDTVIAAARDFLGERITTNASAARAPLARPGHPAAGAARRGRVRRNLGRSGAPAGAVQRRARAGGGLGRRHLAGGPRDAGARRHHARPVAHDPHPRGQPARHGLPHRGRRDARAAQRASARPGPVLPGRSRHRAVHHRRHVRDARLRHQRGALRHDPRERAGADGGAGRRAR